MNYFNEVNFAVTVCDKEGKIIEMNERSKKVNQKEDENLIGNNVIDCHPEPARTKLLELLDSQKSNAYTIEKNGVKKLIYQTPWYENGEYMGLMELSIEIPFEMEHKIRKPKI